MAFIRLKHRNGKEFILNTKHIVEIADHSENGNNNIAFYASNSYSYIVGMTIDEIYNILERIEHGYNENTVFDFRSFCR
jgi:uncharacterized protein YlzI (FlbEa/FlbD family)